MGFQKFVYALLRAEAELAELKKKNRLESLVKELEYERDRNRELSRLLKAGGRVGTVKPSDDKLSQENSAAPGVVDGTRYDSRRMRFSLIF